MDRNDFTPAAVPTPVPTASVTPNTAVQKMNAGREIHSNQRAGIRAAMANPTTAATRRALWRIQSPRVTGLGTLRTPAE